MQEEQEAPSVFSVVNRYIVGRAEVSPPAEDGSRIIRLFSGDDGTIIEAALSPELCAFIAVKLGKVEGAENGDSAG
jgi:hypothetical protein